MPPVLEHVKTSAQRTGKEYRELHEWLDGDPQTKAERHDITRIYEFGKRLEEQYGKEGLQEYIRHLQDDMAAKFRHVQEDLEKALSDVLAYFGIK